MQSWYNIAYLYILNCKYVHLYIMICILVIEDLNSSNISGLYIINMLLSACPAPAAVARIFRFDLKQQRNSFARVEVAQDSQGWMIPKTLVALSLWHISIIGIIAVKYCYQIHHNRVHARGHDQIHDMRHYITALHIPVVQYTSIAAEYMVCGDCV